MSQMLYRYMSFESFVDTVQKQQLHFVHPSEFEDPLEFQYLQKMCVTDPSSYIEILYRFAMIYRFYVQSWTYLPESDAMWRIYNHNNFAVRIEIDRKSVDLLDDVQAVDVIYTDEPDEYIKKQANGRLITEYKNLAIKRSAFEHEKEVRLVKHIRWEHEKDAYENTLLVGATVFEHVECKKSLLELYSDYSEEEISKVINDKLKDYNVVGICVSNKPRPIDNSYMPVFSVGCNFGKLLSSVNDCSFYETSHQENHIEASLFNNNLDNKERFIAVHISGGTTEILLINKNKCGYDIEIVGGSLDVSFGQLIDRLGVKLNYNFPCGKFIDENALKCNQKMEKGLKTSVKEGYMNLSGIENQINKIINDYDSEYMSKILLDTLIRSMYKSLIFICEKYKINEVIFGGGVSASKYINKELSEKLKKEKIKAYFTEAQYATDNALGCAIIGLNKMNDL